MISINLLPSSMQMQQKTAPITDAAVLSNRVLLLGVGGAMAILVLAYCALVIVPGYLVKTRLGSWQRQWTEIALEFQEVDAFAKQKRLFTHRMSELRDKQKQRVRWARLLNAVSDVVPPSIQLIRVSSGELAEMVPEPPKPGAPPGATAAPVVKIRAFFRMMELEGIAQKGQLGDEDLKALMEAMRSNEVFAHNFERIELVGVMTRKDLSKRFSLRCRFKENRS
jgi:Tfp pilus assembly protein PilN